MTLSRRKAQRVLGVSSNASTNEINKAYRKQIRIDHPDKGGDVEKSKLLNEARRILLQELDPDTTEDESADDDEEEEDLFRNIPRPSDEIKINLEKYRDGFLKENFSNNFPIFYKGLMEEGIKLLENKTKFESYFCTQCKKHFVDLKHHFDVVINPYVYWIIGGARENIFEYLREALGDSNDVKMDCFDQKFWKDPIWNDIPQTIQHVGAFTKEMKNPELDVYLKHIEMEWKLYKLYSHDEVSFDLLISNTKRDVEFSSIKLDYQGDKSCIKAGETFRVDPKLIKFTDNWNFPSLKSSDMPFYTIQAAPKQENVRLSLSCSVCGVLTLLIRTLHHCKVCGKAVCAKCFQKRNILSMGYNTPATVCNPCVRKCDEEDAYIWAKRALELLGEKRVEFFIADRVRVLILICNQYCKSLTATPNSVKEVYTQIASESLSQQDFGTFILIKHLQGVENYGWMDVACIIAQAGDQGYTYAMACLKTIPKHESVEWWEEQGHIMGKYKAELAMFCYRKCNFKTMDWIGKIANKYDARIEKEDKPIYHQMIFLSMEKGLELIPQYSIETLKQTIIKLFVVKKYRLGLYSLMAAHLETDTVVSILRTLYSNTKEVFSVVLLLKYIVLKFPLAIVKKVGKENVLFCTVIHELINPPVFRLNHLIDCLNNVHAVPAIIPLLVRLKDHQDFNGWTTYANVCIARKKFLASVILFRIAELSDGFTRCKWEEFGNQIMDEAEDESQKQFALSCFMLGNLDTKPLILRFIDNEEHKLAIKLSVASKHEEILHKTGLKLLRELKIESALLYYGAYVQMIEVSNKPLDIKMKCILEILSEVFDKDSDFFFKLHKSLLKTFQREIFTVAAFPSHLQILKNELKHQQFTFHTVDRINAALHFLPQCDEINEKMYTFQLQNTLNAQLFLALGLENFLQLKEILLHILPRKEIIEVVKGFIKLRTEKLDGQPRPEKVLILMLQGTLAIVENNPVKALKFFEDAMDCYPEKCRDISACVSAVFIDNCHAHETIINSMLKEMVAFNSFAGNPELLRYQTLPIFAPECDPTVLDKYDDFSHPEFDEERLLKVFENSIKHSSRSRVDIAYFYCDIGAIFKTPTAKTAAYLMAIANFLKALEESTSPAAVYALHCVIYEICTKIFPIMDYIGTPYLQTYSARMIFSTLLKANIKMAAMIGEQPSFNKRFSAPKKFDIIPLQERKFIHSVLMTLINLGSSNPFVGTPFCSIIDLYHMDTGRTQFFQNFYDAKCKSDHQSMNLPKYIFDMYRLDGVFQGWFELDKEAAIEALKEHFLKPKATEDIKNRWMVFTGYLNRWNFKADEKEFIKNREEMKMKSPFIAEDVLRQLSRLVTSQKIKSLLISMLLQVELEAEKRKNKTK